MIVCTVHCTKDRVKGLVGFGLEGTLVQLSRSIMTPPLSTLARGRLANKICDAILSRDPQNAIIHPLPFLPSLSWSMSTVTVTAAPTIKLQQQAGTPQKVVTVSLCKVTERFRGSRPPAV